MSFGMTKGEKIFNYINITLLALLCLVALYPFLYVLFASFSDAAPLMRHRGLLFAPIGFQTQAYKMVFDNPILLISYSNTLFYVVAGTAISMLLTIMGAYAFSRRGTMWGNKMMLILVFTMWFSGGLIPFYLMVRDLNMLNTRWALIIPRAISTYNLIIMRTAFASVPESLEESARMDGAKDLTILFRIILPLSLPVVAVVALFYSVGQWNAWFDAMIFINQKRTLIPIQLILREILVLNSTEAMMAGSAVQADQMNIAETIKYAIVIVATVPILCVYPFLQRFFVKGVMIGAVKG